MSETKHTPGPWEYATAGGYEGGRYQPDEYFVRRPEDDVAIASEIIDPDSCKMSHANACLIASAPDLLAALEPFAKLAAIMKEGDAFYIVGCEITYEQVRAAADAIAKAKGESQEVTE